MTPERLMHIYLGECGLHAGVLAEAVAEARDWLPFNANNVQHISKEQLRILDQIAYRFSKLQDTKTKLAVFLIRQVVF